MLETLIEILKKSEADDWQITDTRTNGWEFYFIKHELDQNRIKRVESINVTVYKQFENGRYLGKASGEIAPTESRDYAQRFIDELIKKASLIRNPYYELRKPSDSVEAVHEAVDIAENAKEFILAMQQTAETETGDINSYEIFVDSVTRRLVTGTGIDIEETFPKSMLEVVVNARNEKQEIELYRMYHSGRCDRNGVQASINQALLTGKDRLTAQKTPNLGRFDVIFTSDDAKQICGYFLMKLSAQAVYRKLSDFQLGEEIAHEVEGDLITLKTLKHLPNSSADTAYDAEGALIKDVTLMENNVPCAYWGDTMFSSWLKLENTFIVSNYEVSGGKYTEQELRNRDYLEVVEFSDFQVSWMTGDIFGEIRLGYLCKDGRRIPVSGGSVSGNMRDFINKMYCSREQIVNNNVRMPSVIKLCDVVITGAE